MQKLKVFYRLYLLLFIIINNWFSIFEVQMKGFFIGAGLYISSILASAVYIDSQIPRKLKIFHNCDDITVQSDDKILFQKHEIKYANKVVTFTTFYNYIPELHRGKKKEIVVHGAGWQQKLDTYA